VIGLREWSSLWGGLVLLAAIALVCAFLVYVAAPLFEGRAVEATKATSYGSDDSRAMSVHPGEYGALAWIYHQDATLDVVDIASGDVIDHQRLFAAAVPTAVSSQGVGTGSLAAGFADGTIQIARVHFREYL